MTAALEGGEWSAARPGRTLPPGKTRYLFYGILRGPHGLSGRTEYLFPTGFRSRTAQPVAQWLYLLSYRAHTIQNSGLNISTWRWRQITSPQLWSPCTSTWQNEEIIISAVLKTSNRQFVAISNNIGRLVLEYVSKCKLPLTEQQTAKEGCRIRLPGIDCTGLM